jgi:hypothetical protein
VILAIGPRSRGRANVKAARAGHYPTIDGFINYQDGSNSTHLEGFDSPIDSEAQTTVYACVTVPLFTGGRTSCSRGRRSTSATRPATCSSRTGARCCARP